MRVPAISARLLIKRTTVCAAAGALSSLLLVLTLTPASPASADAAPTFVVDTPSLSNGLVVVPITTTGSGFPPYATFNIHLRWDSSVFRFASASTVGGLFDPTVATCQILQPDAGGGVIYSCLPTGHLISTSGLLAMISLTRIQTGCSRLHLLTIGAPDGGNTSTGTFVAVGSGPLVGTPEPSAYVDGSANDQGTACAPGTPTPGTPFPTRHEHFDPHAVTYARHGFRRR